MTLAIKPEYRQKLKVMIARQEDFRQYPYKDLTGHETIGYGRNLRINGISQDEALILMENDLMKAEEELWKTFPGYEKLSDARKVVLIDMAFNLGIEGFMQFRGMILAIDANDFDKAAEEMLESLWATQTKSRAIQLAMIMRTGVL